jgi:hypothetical protein
LPLNIPAPDEYYGETGTAFVKTGAMIHGLRAWRAGALTGVEMMIKMKAREFSLTVGAATAVMLSASAAGAATIDWNAWSGPVTTSATSGSASGTAGSVGVTYTGELENLFLGYPSWGPSGTFNGGTISNAPTPSDGIVQLFGGGSVVDTITFSHAVTNPVMAIWSLGQGGINASFQFTGEPFAIESGGPSAEYGGQSITSTGDAVFGSEGNGTIQFIGTFKSISWTNPTFENWYGFDVGVGAVPEPSTWAMMLVGFGGLGAMLRSRRKILAA